jgi:hypothetical protein
MKRKKSIAIVTGGARSGRGLCPHHPDGGGKAAILDMQGNEGKTCRSAGSRSHFVNTDV